MSSILTNNSAMVALQTLKSVNSNLSMTQGEISTGKSVASARDNSAVWAISKTMESDVAGFNAISESLSLGSSTVAVARNASETVTDLLTQMKEKIVAAQEENVDRAKIQTDIEALSSQIESVTGAAQFNGLNLVKGFDDVTVLSSLDRSSDGAVTASNIGVARQDLSTQAGSLGTGAGLTNLGTGANITATSTTLASAAVRDDGAGTPVDADLVFAGNMEADAIAFNINGTTVNFAVGELGNAGALNANVQLMADRINAAQIDGISVTANGANLEFESTVNFDQVDVTATITGVATVNYNGTGAGATQTASLDRRAESFTFANANVNKGDGYQFSFDGITGTYVAAAGETMEDVVKGLRSAIDSSLATAGVTDFATNVRQDATTNEWVLDIANTNSDSTDTATLTIVANDDANENAVISGGLVGMDTMDVTTDEGAAAALANIETLIDNSIDAAAQFGSSQARIENQSEFISNLTDSLKSGIGSLVDANMEEVSARLQALQVQQQLAVQSLSIANQAPQSILSLFR